MNRVSVLYFWMILIFLLGCSNNKKHYNVKDINTLSVLIEELKFNRDTLYELRVKVLPNIERISLINTSLKEIPPYLSNLEKLDIFSIKGGKVAKIPDMSNYLNISVLRLDNNKIKHFPSKNYLPTNLFSLSLDNNYFEDSLIIKELPKYLEWLTLTNNKIKYLKIEDSNQNSKLFRLSLDNNNIEVLDSSFVNLPNLSWLDILDNPIKEIHYKGIRNLKTLMLSKDIKLDTSIIRTNLPDTKIIFK